MNEEPKLKQKLETSVQKLQKALGRLKEAREDPVVLAGIGKWFEVCLEYAWKYLKQRVEHEGLEAQSPREAIKRAGQIELIGNVEEWLDFLKDRNFAVHDYLGVSDESYLETIQAFSKAVKEIL